MAMLKDYQVREDIAAAIALGTPPIRAFRVGEGVSPSVLATATDVSTERMLRLEEGATPTDDELLDISNALSVPIALLDGTASIP
jgi:hypothetical protein